MRLLFAACLSWTFCCWPTPVASFVPVPAHEMDWGTLDFEQLARTGRFEHSFDTQHSTGARTTYAASAQYATHRLEHVPDATCLALQRDAQLATVAAGSAAAQRRLERGDLLLSESMHACCLALHGLEDGGAACVLEVVRVLDNGTFHAAPTRDLMSLVDTLEIDFVHRPPPPSLPARRRRGAWVDLDTKHTADAFSFNYDAQKNAAAESLEFGAWLGADSINCTNCFARLRLGAEFKLYISRKWSGAASIDHVLVAITGQLDVGVTLRTELPAGFQLPVELPLAPGVKLPLLAIPAGIFAFTLTPEVIPELHLGFVSTAPVILTGGFVARQTMRSGIEWRRGKPINRIFDVQSSASVVREASRSLFDAQLFDVSVGSALKVETSLGVNLAALAVAQDPGLRFLRYDVALIPELNFHLGKLGEDGCSPTQRRLTAKRALSMKLELGVIVLRVEKGWLEFDLVVGVGDSLPFSSKFYIVKPHLPPLCAVCDRCIERPVDQAATMLPPPAAVDANDEQRFVSIPPVADTPSLVESFRLSANVSLDSTALRIGGADASSVTITWKTKAGSPPPMIDFACEARDNAEQLVGRVLVGMLSPANYAEGQVVFSAQHVCGPDDTTNTQIRFIVIDPRATDDSVFATTEWLNIEKISPTDSPVLLHGPWGPCEVDCGEDFQLRELVCLDANHRNVTLDECKGLMTKSNVNTVRECFAGDCQYIPFEFVQPKAGALFDVDANGDTVVPLTIKGGSPGGPKTEIWICPALEADPCKPFATYIEHCNFVEAFSGPTDQNKGVVDTMLQFEASLAVHVQFAQVPFGSQAVFVATVANHDDRLAARGAPFGLRATYDVRFTVDPPTNFVVYGALGQAKADAAASVTANIGVPINLQVPRSYLEERASQSATFRAQALQGDHAASFTLHWTPEELAALAGANATMLCKHTSCRLTADLEAQVATARNTLLADCLSVSDALRPDIVDVPQIEQKPLLADDPAVHNDDSKTKTDERTTNPSSATHLLASPLVVACLLFINAM